MLGRELSAKSYNRHSSPEKVRPSDRQMTRASEGHCGYVGPTDSPIFFLSSPAEVRKAADYPILVISFEL